MIRSLLKNSSYLPLAYLRISSTILSVCLILDLIPESNEIAAWIATSLGSY